jgi:hypothetical protein
VTNHPAEKQLGVKVPPLGLRYHHPSNIRAGTPHEFPTSGGVKSPIQTLVSAGSQHDREEIITAPDRIFVSTTYEVGISA